MMDIEMRTWYGAPAYFVLGAVHAIVFWIDGVVLTPLILLVCLFQPREPACCTISGRNGGDQQSGQDSRPAPDTADRHGGQSGRSTFDDGAQSGGRSPGSMTRLGGQ